MSVSPAFAQAISSPPVLTAPAILSLPTSLGPGSDEFQPDAGIRCPTPSLGLYGFGVSGRDNFSNYDPFGSANTGRDNYGISGGFSVPISGGLAESCKKYFEAKARYETARSEMQNRENQLLLLRQCFWIEENSFDLSHPGLQQEAFKDLKPCIALKGFADKRNKAAAGRGAPIPDPRPPVLPDSFNKPFSPTAPIIIEERSSRNRGGTRVGIDVGL
jgi:hypothetical protein